MSTITEQTPDIVEMAEKKRHIYLLKKLKDKGLSKNEIKELREITEAEKAKKKRGLKKRVPEKKQYRNKSDSSYQWEKEYRKAKALTAQAEYKKMIGELVPIGDVKKAAFNMARKLRDNFLAIPDRLGPVCASETNPEKVRNILMKEIKAVLENLGKQGQEILEKGSDDKGS